MLELIIKDQVYEFNFGMGFLRELNKLVKVPIDDFKVDKSVGFTYYLADMIDGNPEALVTILFTANRGRNPRVTPALLDEYIDDPGTDIDNLTEEVLGFLKNANSTKKSTLKMLEAATKTEA